MKRCYVDDSRGPYFMTIKNLLSVGPRDGLYYVTSSGGKRRKIYVTKHCVNSRNADKIREILKKATKTKRKPLAGDSQKEETVTDDVQG